jgi:predicted Zn-dependent protease
MRLDVLAVLVALPLLAVAAKETPPPVDGRARLADALAAEAARATKELRLGDEGPPFFVGLQVKEFDTREVVARFGAVVDSAQRRRRSLLADVRVGSYELDSTADPDALGFDFDADAGDGWEPDDDLPLDDDPKALRRATWLVVDDKYKRALAAYLKKRGRQVYRPDEADRAPSFSRAPPVSYAEPPKAFPFDAAAWAAELRRASAALLAQPGLFDSEARVQAEKIVRVFVSSEGSRVVTEQRLYVLRVRAFARAPDGMLLENGRDLYAESESSLPRGAALDREVAQLAEELTALRAAPLADPFTGPALLSPQAAGVLFHEAVGHRLEGERQDDENEGRTFRGQVGQRVLPPFVTIVDDPTRAFFEVAGQPVPLNGFYRYDEQGVAAEPVTLVEDGVLRGYLMGRRPVKGFSRSNGHGRSAGNRMPVARMANLVVLPKAPVPEAELKRRLVEEARRQGKPYGLYVKDVKGGNTNTSGAGYQAFKGMTRLVYRVRASDGAEELVRGVELVGTPLSTVNRIVAMGDRPGVFNGFCGAESGYVPVSTVSPAVLVGEFELQRTRKSLGRPPLLPPP